MIQFLEKNIRILYLLAVCLLIPALLTNLGVFPLISDEHIRGLVALEMIISDDYFVPTMYGEFYLKKPPLFNWILIGFSQITGNFDEASLRLPTIIATLLYGTTIFLALRKKFSTGFAFTSALVFITCGRMLFWDTQLALIDITFSWVIFTNFMVIYHFFKKEKYFALFFASYFLTSIAYMLKGIPALVFQASTLLVFFAYKRKFLKLISWQHILGILLFTSILASYYIIYFNRFSGTFEELINTLFGETTRRTVLRFGWERTIHHYMMFPFDQLYHFLPWSILIIMIVDIKLFRSFLNIKQCRVGLVFFLVTVIVYFTLNTIYSHTMLLLIPAMLFFFIQLYKTARKGLLDEGIELQIKISNVVVVSSLVLIGFSFLIKEETVLFKIIQYSVTLLLFALIAFTTRFLFSFNIIFRDDFIKYLSITFFANILVYWTSPEVHPRYILMLAPLYFIVLLYTFEQKKASDTRRIQILEKTLIAVAVLASAGVFLLLVFPGTRNISFIIVKTIAIFLGLGFFSLLMIKMKNHRLLIFAIILIIARIGFNWIAVEARAVKAHEVTSRKGAIELARKTTGYDLYIYKGSWMDDFGAFYITRERMKLLKRKYNNFDTNAYYIVDGRFFNEQPFEELFSYEIVWERKPVKLAKIRGNISGYKQNIKKSEN